LNLGFYCLTVSFIAKM